jgi:hypothetical protein
MIFMKKLPFDRLRGSLLRCLLLTGQPPNDIAELLSELIKLPNVVISPRDHWMPRGLRDYKETTLVDCSYFLTPEKRKALTEWWLEKPRGAMLPNWDIASTCNIEDRRGLLLVEAKAHDKELSEAGKSEPTSDNSKLNHEQIKTAIVQANVCLNAVVPGWRLSRDSHYQLSNRFAWAWKLATLGIPVILVYLGFLNAEEMFDQGQPFDSIKTWHDCIRNHAKNIVPEGAWEKRIEIDSTPLWFLIRSMRLKMQIVD